MRAQAFIPQPGGTCDTRSPASVGSGVCVCVCVRVQAPTESTGGRASERAIARSQFACTSYWLRTHAKLLCVRARENVKFLVQTCSLLVPIQARATNASFRHSEAQTLRRAIVRAFTKREYRLRRIPLSMLRARAPPPPPTRAGKMGSEGCVCLCHIDFLLPLLLLRQRVRPT